MKKLLGIIVVIAVILIANISAFAVLIEYQLNTPLIYQLPGTGPLGSDPTFALTFTLDTTATPYAEGELGQTSYSVYQDVLGNVTVSGSGGSGSDTPIDLVDLKNLYNLTYDRMRIITESATWSFDVIIETPDLWAVGEMPRPEALTNTNDWYVDVYYLGSPSYVARGEDFPTIEATARVIEPVPEPSTILLIGTGLVGFAVPQIRRKLKR